MAEREGLKLWARQSRFKYPYLGAFYRFTSAVPSNSDRRNRRICHPCVFARKIAGVKPQSLYSKTTNITILRSHDFIGVKPQSLYSKTSYITILRSHDFLASTCTIFTNNVPRLHDKVGKVKQNGTRKTKQKQDCSLSKHFRQFIFFRGHLLN